MCIWITMQLNKTAILSYICMNIWRYKTTIFGTYIYMCLVQYIIWKYDNYKQVWLNWNCPILQGYIHRIIWSSLKIAVNGYEWVIHAREYDSFVTITISPVCILLGCNFAPICNWMIAKTYTSQCKWNSDTSQPAPESRKTKIKKKSEISNLKLEQNLVLTN